MVGFFNGLKGDVMEVLTKIAKELINYYPINEKAKIGKNEIDLGEVDGFRIIHEMFSFQRRAVHLPGEPKIPECTRQPILALAREEEGDKKKREIVHILAYSSDVAVLGEVLAQRILDHLKTRRSLMQFLDSF